MPCLLFDKSVSIIYRHIHNSNALLMPDCNEASGPPQDVGYLACRSFDYLNPSSSTTS